MIASEDGPDALDRSLLPWLDPVWSRLWAAHAAGRLGHALLFAGPAGIGKRLLVARLASALLCAAPGDDGAPCGHCPECRLIRAGNHPDWARLEVTGGADDGHDIRIDEIRELIHETALTGHRGTCRIVSIAPAEAMNHYAANALLKTLEEPADEVLLLLVSEDPSRLPATVRSRCRRINLPMPPEHQGLDWLRQQLPSGQVEPDLLLRVAHGAPLRALTLLGGDQLAMHTKVVDGLVAVGRTEQDPVDVAGVWQAMDTALVLRSVAAWVSDVLRVQVDQAASHISHPDRRSELVRLAAAVSPQDTHRYLKFVLEAVARAGTSVNTRMLFESLLARWALVARGGY
jgi:DNA polymerase-3 subunit delta'